MQPLGIGIISFAHGHSQQYCLEIAEFDDARVIAAWDDNEERGRPICEQFGLEFETSVDSLLARADIDAVIVTCETNAHADVIEKACAAGKDILCQKPLATTLEDCDRIIAAVEKSGVHFQMAFQMRQDPLNKKIKEWVDNGEVGRIGSLRRRHCINFLFSEGLKEGPNAWHVDPVKNVGMFFDDAVHAADFFLWLLGKPQSVMAEIDNTLTDVAPDDTGLAIYRWKNGPMAVLFNSSVTLAAENTCEIYGDQGVIIQNYDDGVSVAQAPADAKPLKLYRKNSNEWENFDFKLPASHADRLRAIPRPWIDNIKAGAPSAITARDGRDSVEMCLAAYQSAREGRRIEF